MKGSRKSTEERVLLVANYFVNHDSTIRKTAKSFDLSKDCVHTDLRKRLPSLYNSNSSLVSQVNALIELNKAERSMRGGQATKYYWEERKREEQQYDTI
ncbi:MAG: Stage III sporulation protein D [Syntrophomonadaceae bacterium]|nr:Stage III sporulation protein D [Bacillota bacterium]